jgi:SAM-dependent methyltransferase
MINYQEFLARGLELSREAGVEDTLHGYFLQSASRLHKALGLFGLADRQLGDVLEIGPFYGYTPFLLRDRANSFLVWEGNDPAAHALKPLYEKRRIQLQFLDLFEIFGPTRTAKHVFDMPDASFDSLLCWETMEHFNFSPVKFTRELFRILKPGGRAYITVPNRASFQNLAELILGRSDRRLIDHYYQFEDYVCDGKKAFYGFHWREYTRRELPHLFERSGFKIAEAGTFVAFQTQERTSPGRKLARALSVTLGSVFPRFATHVYLVAEKPR